MEHQNPNWWNGQRQRTGPACGDTAVFGGSGDTNPYTATLGSNIATAGIIFADQNYTIAPDAINQYGLTIGSGGITANASATISTRWALAANQTWAAASGTTLTVSGSVSGGYEIPSAFHRLDLLVIPPHQPDSNLFQHLARQYNRRERRDGRRRY